MRYVKCTFYAIVSWFLLDIAGEGVISWFMKVHEKGNDNIKY